MNKHIRFPYWFIIILLAAFAVGYWAWMEDLNYELGITSYGSPSTRPPSGDSLEATSEYAGWKTYRNEEHGFAVGYPDKFELNEDVLLNNGPVLFDTFKHKFFHGGIIPKGEMVLTIFSQVAPPDLNAFIATEEGQVGAMGAIKKENITIDGNLGKLVTSENSSDLPSSMLQAYVVDNNHLWKITLELADATIDSSVLNLFHQILSTFKFLDSKSETKLGQEFTLRKGESARVDENFSVKVTGFVYSPCPGGAVCVWSGLGIDFEYDYNGQKKSGLNLHEAFGYQVAVVSTDYQTFATLVVSKSTQ